MTFYPKERLNELVISGSDTSTGVEKTTFTADPDRYYIICCYGPKVIIADVSMDLFNQ